MDRSGEQSSKARFDLWYETFSKRLHEERNPIRTLSNDPRIASGPWGIRSPTLPLAPNMYVSHDHRRGIANIAGTEVPPGSPIGSLVPLGAPAMHVTKPIEGRRLPDPPMQQPSLTADVTQQLALMFYQESATRNSIVTAESKFRHLWQLKVPARETPPPVRIAAIALQFQCVIQGVMADEASRRLNLIESSDAWFLTILQKEKTMRSDAPQSYPLAWLTQQNMIRLEVAEAQQRANLHLAFEASIQLLELRSSKLKASVAQTWKDLNAVSGPSYNPNGKGYLTVVKAALIERNKSALEDLAMSEGSRRHALEVAEEAHRDAIRDALLARSTVAAGNCLALRQSIRACLIRGTAPCEEAESYTRRILNDAADGWLQRMLDSFVAGLAVLVEKQRLRARLVAAALERLPKLSDLEEDEAARRRYFIKSYDEWSAKTFSIAVARALTGHTIRYAAATVAATQAQALLMKLVPQEAAARTLIWQGEADWRRHIEELSRADAPRREANVVRYVQSRPLVNLSHAQLQAIRVLEEDEMSQRKALESAEQQWARFNASRLKPNGQLPTLASFTSTTSVPWDIQGPFRTVEPKQLPPPYKDKKVADQPLTHRSVNTTARLR